MKEAQTVYVQKTLIQKNEFKSPTLKQLFQEASECKLYDTQNQEVKTLSKSLFELLPSPNHYKKAFPRDELPKRPVAGTTIETSSGTWSYIQTASGVHRWTRDETPKNDSKKTSKNKTEDTQGSANSKQKAESQRTKNTESGWYEKNFNKLLSDSEVEVISAEVAKGLAIHKDSSPNVWAVSHENSGKQLLSQISTKENAKKLAELLFEVMDWTLDEKTISAHKNFSKVREKLQELQKIATSKGDV